MHYHASMAVLPNIPMNVDDDLAWAQSHPGRSALSDGEVIVRSPDGAGHAAPESAVRPWHRARGVAR